MAGNRNSLFSKDLVPGYPSREEYLKRREIVAILLQGEKPEKEPKGLKELVSLPRP